MGVVRAASARSLQRPSKRKRHLTVAACASCVCRQWLITCALQVMVEGRNWCDFDQSGLLSANMSLVLENIGEPGLTEEWLGCDRPDADVRCD